MTDGYVRTARRPATRCSQGALDPTRSAPARARSKRSSCRSISMQARPRCRWSSRVSGFCADSRSRSLAGRSARGCIRRRRELSRQSSRDPRRIASELPRSASSWRTTAATSVMRQLRRRRSNNSRPNSCASIIARGGIVGLGGAVFPTAAKLSSASAGKRIATAAQRRRVRALHQLRRHVDARTRARCRLRRPRSASRALGADVCHRNRGRHAAGGRSARRCDRRCPRRANPVATSARASIRPAARSSSSRRSSASKFLRAVCPRTSSTVVPERRHGSCHRSLGSRRAAADEPHRDRDGRRRARATQSRRPARHAARGIDLRLRRLHRPHVATHHGRLDDGPGAAARRHAGDQGDQLRHRRIGARSAAARGGDAMHPLRQLLRGLPRDAPAATAALVRFGPRSRCPRNATA